MKKRALGYGCGWQGLNYHFGHPDVSTVRIELTDDQMLRVGVAAADLGQGIPETNRVIVSSAFGSFPIERIECIDPDTAVTPDGGATGASRQTALTGNAALLAAEKLADRVKLVASEMLDLPPEEVQIDGMDVIGAPGQAIKLKDVIDECRRMGISLVADATFQGSPTTDLDEQGQGFPVNQFSYATYIADVEVDTDTGEVKVLGIDAFVDAGRIIRRIGAEMQVEGGIAMGLGHTLTEEFKQAEGWPLTEGLTTYLIPTVFDVPFHIDSDFLGEDPIPFGKLGAKGLAELVLVPIAPAITNAIYNATGAVITTLPATPERVLQALREVEASCG